MDFQTYIAFIILFLVLALAGKKAYNLVFARDDKTQEGCGPECKCRRH